VKCSASFAATSAGMRLLPASPAAIAIATSPNASRSQKRLQRFNQAHHREAEATEKFSEMGGAEPAAPK